MAGLIEQKRQRIELEREETLARVNPQSFDHGEYMKKRDQGINIYKTRDLQKERNRKIDQQIMFERFGILPDDE